MFSYLLYVCICTGHSDIENHPMLMTEGEAGCGVPQPQRRLPAWGGEPRGFFAIQDPMQK